MPLVRLTGSSEQDGHRGQIPGARFRIWRGNRLETQLYTLCDSRPEAFSDGVFLA